MYRSTNEPQALNKFKLLIKRLQQISNHVRVDVYEETNYPDCINVYIDAYDFDDSSWIVLEGLLQRKGAKKVIFDPDTGDRDRMNLFSKFLMEKSGEDWVIA